jgi:RND family efflux transporter MFP subunit
MMIFGVVAVAAVIGTAGYLGYRNAQPPQPVVQTAPPTMKVGRGDVEKSVTAPGQLVNDRQTVLGMEEGGRLTSVNVSAGDYVTVGQVLATIDPAALRAAADKAYADYVAAQAQYSVTVKPPSAASVASAQSSLTSAQAKYADLSNPPSESKVAGLRAALQNAEAELKRAQADYDIAYQMDAAGIGGSGAGLALEKATNAYHAAKATYDAAFEPVSSGDVKNALAGIASARAALEALTPTTQTLALAQANLEKERLAWEQAEEAAKKTVLVAPVNGIVTEVKVNVGDSVQAGAKIFTLVDPHGLEVKSTVAEEDLPYVKVGQPVQVYLDALPDAQLTGTVKSIVPVRTSDTSPLYPVYITIDPIPDGVATGMTVDGSIVISKVSNVLRLPRALVQAGTSDTAQVEVWANGARETRKVKVGLRGDTYVEILSGLQEGEQVVSQ